VKKFLKNRPAGDVVSVTQRQVKKKTNITHSDIVGYVRMFVYGYTDAGKEGLYEAVINNLIIC
jgi:hypothetical protein